MRKLKLQLILMLAAAAAFASCGKDNTPKPDGTETESVIVTFEGAELPSAGYLLGSDYTEANVVFSQSYTEFDGGFYWNGFAVSNNHDKAVAGLENQFSVYGGGGADGSAKFAVGSVFGDCEFAFAGGGEYEVEYVYVNNSTYAFLAVRDGDDGGFGAVRKFVDGDWFLLTATGYDAAGTKTGDVDFYLADYRDSKTFVCEEWTKIELNGLGKVNKVSFALSSSDNSEWDGVSYMNTPAYFCLDNVSYAKPVAAK